MARKKLTLGRSLAKYHNKKKIPNQHEEEVSTRHSEAEGNQDTRLHSILDENNLEGFMNYATLTNRSFAAQRGNMTLIVDSDPSGSYLLSKGNIVSRSQVDNQQKEKYQKIRELGGLPIPKRPKWDTKMTKEDLFQAENDSFLSWRRKLAHLEESNPDILLTPFEKNLQVWRQLWRVMERSHVCVQIVDSRNPLTFRCRDLEKYAKKLDPDKENILLLNKADLLSEQQRELWAMYFQKNNIPFLFFSAKEEEEKIANTESDAKRAEQLDFDAIDIENWENPALNNPTHVFNREELLCFFKSFLKNVKLYQKASMYQQDQGEPRIVIGMIGFPNVGKSSAINVLTGLKTVSVGSTPGKTKHFQTIPIGESIMLCDCPGLVFPSITTTKDDMVLDGVLPIDQLREHRPPVALLCRRIPKRHLEITYGTFIPGKDKYTTSQSLLTAYCQLKGMLTHGGVPNFPSAARKILKDYVNGKLLYCHPPPGAFVEFFPIEIEENEEEDEEVEGEEIDVPALEGYHSQEDDEEEIEIEVEDDDDEFDEEDEEEDIDLDGEEEFVIKMDRKDIEIFEDDQELEDIANAKIDETAEKFNNLNVNKEEIELKYLEKKANKKTTKRSRRAKNDLASAPFAVEVAEDGREILHRMSDLKRHAKNDRREEEKKTGKRLEKKLNGKQRVKYHYSKPTPSQYASPIETMRRQYAQKKAMENIAARNNPEQSRQ